MNFKISNYVMAFAILTTAVSCSEDDECNPSTSNNQKQITPIDIPFNFDVTSLMSYHSTNRATHGTSVITDDVQPTPNAVGTSNITRTTTKLK